MGKTPKSNLCVALLSLLLTRVVCSANLAWAEIVVVNILDDEENRMALSSREAAYEGADQDIQRQIFAKAKEFCKAKGFVALKGIPKYVEVQDEAFGELSYPWWYEVAEESRRKWKVEILKSIGTSASMTVLGGALTWSSLQTLDSSPSWSASGAIGGGALASYGGISTTHYLFKLFGYVTQNDLEWGKSKGVRFAVKKDTSRPRAPHLGFSRIDCKGDDENPQVQEWLKQNSVGRDIKRGDSAVTEEIDSEV